MRTQFKNTDEYKDFSGILKRKSLNVKNRNISLTLKIKKIVEKFPIVEKIREIIIKNLPSCSLMKGKLIISSTDYVYQLCRNVVSKNEIDFKNLNEYITLVIEREVLRKKINSENAEERKNFVTKLCEYIRNCKKGKDAKSIKSIIELIKTNEQNYIYGGFRDFYLKLQSKLKNTFIEKIKLFKMGNEFEELDVDKKIIYVKNFIKSNKLQLADW